MDQIVRTIQSLSIEEQSAVLSQLLLSVQEVLEELNISRTTLSRLEKDGEIVLIKRGSAFLKSSVLIRKKKAEQNVKYMSPSIRQIRKKRLAKKKEQN